MMAGTPFDAIRKTATDSATAADSPVDGIHEINAVDGVHDGIGRRTPGGADL